MWPSSVMPTFSHFAIQAKHALVRDTMIEEAQNPAVAHGIKEAFPFSRKK